MKRIFLGIFAFLLAGAATAQDLKDTSFLTAFARAYGYVKYFHPSDENEQIDWGRFAIYGAEEMRKCTSREQAIATLKRIFYPIAPTAVFTKSEQLKPYDLSRLRPRDLARYKPTWWQHLGVEKDMFYQDRLYQSCRVGVTKTVDRSDQFGTLGTQIDASGLRGQTIRLQGALGLDTQPNIKDAEGRMWLRVDRTNGKVGFFDNMGENPVREGKVNQYTITGTVDEDADRIVLGALLSGRARLQVSSLSLEVRENGNWIAIPLPDLWQKPGETPKEGQWSVNGKGYGYDLPVQHDDYSTPGALYWSSAIETITEEPLFDAKLNFGEMIEKALVPGITLQLPMVLMTNGQNTWPQADAKALQVLKEGLAAAPVGPGETAFNLGNVINAWNVFQHFYPYFEEMKVDWSRALEFGLQESFVDVSLADHHSTLEEMTALLKDGHVRVTSQGAGTYVPDIAWDWIEGQLTITAVGPSVKDLRPGDIVTTVEGQLAQAYFAEVHRRISAATPGYLHRRARIRSMRGMEKIPLRFTVGDKEYKLPRTLNLYKDDLPQPFARPMSRFYEDGVAYLDLDQISIDSIRSLLPRLEKAPAIICDMRGYPRGNHDLISHLLSHKDTSTAWMQVPQLQFPDQERMEGYQRHGWEMEPAQPHLDAKVVFLIDARAISYAESFMGLIDHYELATIVGQTTAGTNGNVNPFELPGGIRISWTGMKVFRHDGKQFHGVGIVPDVEAQRTLEGVKAGRDEFLEVALKVARE